MPLLDILAQSHKILMNPSWLMFGLAGGVGLLGLLALFLLYPMGRD